MLVVVLECWMWVTDVALCSMRAGLPYALIQGDIKSLCNYCCLQNTGYRVTDVKFLIQTVNILLKSFLSST